MYPTDLRRFSGALLLPQPLTFHKPRQAGNGVALKLNLRFKFEWGGEGGEAAAPFIKKTRGGLFVDFAQQGPSANGNATFKWTDRASLVTAKLGLPDLSGLLVAREAVRLRNRAVPVELRPAARDSDDEAAVLRKQLTASFTHKPNAGRGGDADAARATTIISYQFMAEGGVFRVSKSRELVGQVSLSFAEEQRFFRYLELAEDTVLRLGGR